MFRLSILFSLAVAVSACSGSRQVEETITTGAPSTTAAVAGSESSTTVEPTTTTTAGSESIDLGDLGASVLAYGPFEHDPLVLVDGGDQRVVWPGPVDVALPDGQGGVVLQPAGEDSLVWLPDVRGDTKVVLVMVDRVLFLRGFLADGRVVYSERPHPDDLTENSHEEFFAVVLAEGAEPEMITTSDAYESLTIGPVVAAEGKTVHASCHLHCSLWSGLPGTTQDAEALYHGGGAETGPTAALEGLVATPDGKVVAFVEFDIARPDEDEPELVLVDGVSFEVLARVELPLGIGEAFGQPAVSLSADGHRVLVALGGTATEQGALSVPSIPYLVEGVLTNRPQVKRIDAEGAIRWLDPVAASDAG